jgi:hypothetical protein
MQLGRDMNFISSGKVIKKKKLSNNNIMNKTIAIH